MSDHPEAARAGDREAPAIAHLGHSRLDTGRALRTGMPEAVFAAGKTPEQCVQIVARLLSEGDEPVIVTRCDDSHAAALASLAPDDVVGATLTWRHRDPVDAAGVAIVSGGTSDQWVVDEVAAVLTAYGVAVTRIPDVGVAGLHRLTAALDEIAAHEVVVAVAGMEAALPTVLAGLVASPIIAVPTSVGYGTTFEGLTALLSMLSSCAPGITVVGIDNGYGAACAAHRILGALK